jgi:hypothetical protein
VVKRPKQFVYKLVVAAPDWNCIWSWLQIRQSGAANLELSGSSSSVITSLYSLRLWLSEYRLVMTSPSVTNCYLSERGTLLLFNPSSVDKPLCNFRLVYYSKTCFPLGKFVREKWQVKKGEIDSTFSWRFFSLTDDIAEIWFWLHVNKFAEL